MADDPRRPIVSRHDHFSAVETLACNVVEPKGSGGVGPLPMHVYGDGYTQVCWVAPPDVLRAIRRQRAISVVVRVAGDKVTEMSVCVPKVELIKDN